MDPARSHRDVSTDDAWELVAPYRSRLIAVARERGLSLPDAQDVAHHVMCRAVERRPLDPERVEAYLVRAAMNRCQDVREDAVRQEQLLARTRGDDRLVGRLDDAVCDRAQVHWLLDKLPLRERRVVMLSVSGETVTGIAKATGLSYPTVDRLLSRARKEMRRLAGLLGVAGLAVWRQRRLAVPAGATAAAVAVASVTVLAPHVSQGTTSVTVRTPSYAVSETGRSAVRPAKAAALTVSRTVRLAATPMEPITNVPTAPRRPVLPAKPQAEVETDADDPVAHIQECLENGVSVEMGSRTGVVCRDGSNLVDPFGRS